jgi:large subunit ribosomal protein L4e
MAGNNSSVNVYSLGGDVVKTISLPTAFGTTFRPDIIRKAVVAQEANKRQPYGPSKMAGMRHAVSTWGKGRGVARVQRLTQGRKAAESPNNVGGRRAHPPVPEKDLSKKVNRKEKRLAKLSALAATADPDIVKNRGHWFEEEVTLPVVVEDDIEALETTREVLEALENLGLGDDIIRAKEGKHIRAGRGKMRGRRYRRPRSILIVVSEEDAPLVKSAGNLPGVEIVPPNRLNASVLAPGGDAGRLALFTESALGKIGEW